MNGSPSFCGPHNFPLLNVGKPSPTPRVCIVRCHRITKSTHTNMAGQAQPTNSPTQSFFSPDPETTSALMECQERISQNLNNFEDFQMLDHLNMSDNHQFWFNEMDLGGTLPICFDGSRGLTGVSFASASSDSALHQESFATQSGGIATLQNVYSVAWLDDQFLNQERLSFPGRQPAGENWTRLVALITPVDFQRLTIF